MLPFRQAVRTATASDVPRRVQGVCGHPGVYEMTWADDGRATFSYGSPQRSGEVHIVWRHIGTHDILRNP